MIPLLIIAAIAGLAAAAGAAIPRRTGWTVLQLAEYWARRRGLPLSWVLATITVESGGKLDTVGDGGISIGLMQINSRAHATRLARLSLTRESLFDPDTNIMMGTQILREAYDRVRAALGGKTPPAPIDVLTRLVYKGYPVASALREGRALDTNSVARWDAALVKTRALV